MFAIFFIFAAVAHAQLQPTAFRASEVSTYETPIAKNSHTMVLSEETKRMVCDEFCHHLTTGECQQPNLGDDNCYMKLANNGTCPAGTVECGMRPAKEVPTGIYTPGAPTAEVGQQQQQQQQGSPNIDVLEDSPALETPKNVLLPAWFKFGFKFTPKGRADVIAGPAGPRAATSEVLNNLAVKDTTPPPFGFNLTRRSRRGMPLASISPTNSDGSLGVVIYNNHEFYFGISTDQGVKHLRAAVGGSVQLVEGGEYDVEFRILKAGLQVFVDGVVMGEKDMGGDTRKAVDRVDFYGSSGNTNRGEVPDIVSGLWVSDLTGDEEYPLCTTCMRFAE